MQPRKIPPFTTRFDAAATLSAPLDFAAWSRLALSDYLRAAGVPLSEGAIGWGRNVLVDECRRVAAGKAAAAAPAMAAPPAAPLPHPTTIQVALATPPGFEPEPAIDGTETAAGRVARLVAQYRRAFDLDDDPDGVFLFQILCDLDAFARARGLDFMQACGEALDHNDTNP